MWLGMPAASSIAWLGEMFGQVQFPAFEAAPEIVSPRPDS
jgi:hypothetical protein